VDEATRAQSSDDGLGEFLDEWEAAHGPFTVEELTQASKELKLPSPDADPAIRTLPSDK